MWKRTLCGIVLAAGLAGQGLCQDVAIIGATVMDGNGGPPLRDAVIVVTGKKITAIGPRASVTIPAGATRVEAAGRFVVPGLIDTNVHLSLYGGARDRYETLAKYY